MYRISHREKSIAICQRIEESFDCRRKIWQLKRGKEDGDWLGKTGEHRRSGCLVCGMNIQPRDQRLFLSDIMPHTWPWRVLVPHPISAVMTPCLMHSCYWDRREGAAQ